MVKYMAGAHYKKKLRKKYIFRRIAAVVLLLAVIGGVIFAVQSCKKGDDKGGASSDMSSVDSTPKEPYVVSSAVIGSSGDIMCHSTQLTHAKKSDGSYYFEDCFQYVKPYFESYDLMIANLEVTFGGKEFGAFSGYPMFNTPDSMADAVKYSGIDTVLFANNHTYDTGYAGMLRTMKVLKEKGIPFVGTRENESDLFWQIKEVNGIKIGIINYTYSTTTSSGNKALNGNVMKTEAGPLVNTFTYGNLDAFYDDARAAVAAMEQAGADATFIYIHWGNEYQRTPNSYQTKMAQEICDMGYDVIVGSHPHVIQPFAVLTGENGNETLCIYSTGNLISNQRANLMDSDNYSGHTEDGMIFSVKYDKYSDGKIVVSDVNIQPLWVDMNTATGKRIYRIVALDTSVDNWKNLGVVNLANAKKSYNRTMKLVGEPLNAYRAQKGWTEVALKAE